MIKFVNVLMVGILIFCHKVVMLVWFNFVKIAMVTYLFVGNVILVLQLALGIIFVRDALILIV